MRQCQCESCIHGEMEIMKTYGVWGRGIEKLSIFCQKKYRFIGKIISDCDDYHASTEKTIRIGKKRYKQTGLIQK